MPPASAAVAVKVVVASAATETVIPGLAKVAALPLASAVPEQLPVG